VLVVTALLGRPLLGPAVAALALTLPLLLVRPVAFLVLVTVAEVANLSDVGAANGLPRGESVLLACALAAALLAWRRGQVRPAWSPFFGMALVYLTVQALAALGSNHVDAGLTTMMERAKALLWPLALVILMLARDKAPLAVARAFALTLAVLSALTLFQEFVLHDSSTLAGLANVPLAADVGGVTARHAGPQADANFWGRILVLGLPFALTLTKLTASVQRRVLWGIAALLICAGVVLTGSRGAMLALILVTLLWALLTGGGALKSLALAPLVFGLALLVPGVGSRLLTLSTIGAGSSSLVVGDPSLQGRLAAQRVAIQMFLDHPVLGVGPGNFLTFAQDYLHDLALNAPPLVAHNSYLEAAAEGGFLGFLAWIFLLGAAVFVALRARLLARPVSGALDTGGIFALSNAVLAALAGWAVASVFLNLATFRSFLFVCAIGVVLDVRARRRVGELMHAGLLRPPRVSEVVAPARKALRREVWRVMALLTVGLLVLAGGMWTVGGRQASWAATSSLQMVIKYSSDPQTPAYDLDTLSRSNLVRTFAELSTSTRFVEEAGRSVRDLGGRTDGVTVEVSSTLPSALIVVTAHGRTAKEATDMTLAVRDRVLDYLNSISPLYGALPTSLPPGIHRSAPPLDRRLAAWPLGVAGVLVVLLGGAVFAGVRDQRRRPGRHSHLAASRDSGPGAVGLPAEERAAEPPLEAVTAHHVNGHGRGALSGRPPRTDDSTTDSGLLVD